MIKDFDQWNTKKKEIENNNNKFLFKTGDIWWCSVGINIKEESCGKGKDYQRPVLVIRKLSSNLFIGIPISTKEKVGSWFIEIKINNEKRYVLLYQIRIFSVSRFQRRLSILTAYQLKLVKEKLKLLLEF